MGSQGHIERHVTTSYRVRITQVFSPLSSSGLSDLNLKSFAKYMNKMKRNFTPDVFVISNFNALAGIVKKD